MNLPVRGLHDNERLRDSRSFPLDTPDDQYSCRHAKPHYFIEGAEKPNLIPGINGIQNNARLIGYTLSLSYRHWRQQARFFRIIPITGLGSLVVFLYSCDKKRECWVPSQEGC